MRRIRRSRRALERREIDHKAFNQGLLGWIAHAAKGDTWALRRALFKRYLWRVRRIESSSGQT